jgi:hypothetical protein
LCATAYESAIATPQDASTTVTPRAKAIAHVRRNPVRRETSVETDIDAVERAMDGLAMTAPMVSVR